MIQVVRGIIATGVERPRDEISTENLFDDVKRKRIAWNVIIEHDDTLRYFEGEWTSEQVKIRLSELLDGLWYSTVGKKHLRKKRSHRTQRGRRGTEPDGVRFFGSWKPIAKESARQSATGNGELQDVDSSGLLMCTLSY